MSKHKSNEDLFNEAWSQFSKLITSEEDAADAIFQSLSEDKKIDCGCDNSVIFRQSGERFFCCRTCKRKVHFTAGTLFAGSSRLRAWLAATFFQGLGLAVSSLRLSRLLDIAQSTALNINKKVSAAIISKMDEAAPTVDARLFSQVIFKRSRQTPADEHPRSELSDQPKPEPESEADPDPVSSNNAHRKTVQTNLPTASTTLQLSISMLAAAAVAFIRTYFDGVSHKYLQLYLAAFWCHRDRESWSPASVLRACLSHPPISYLELLHYKVQDIRMMPL